MAQEKMTQDEIDALMRSYKSGEIEGPVKIPGSLLNRDKCKFSYNAVRAAKARYEYAMNSGPFDAAEEARRNLHRAASGNWLMKKGLTRQEYYRLMNQEARKRGLPPPFPGR